MPRKAGIWKRAGSDWWYTTRGTNKVRLSKDRQEALRLFHRLMAEGPESSPSPAVGPTFKKLANDFLGRTAGDKSAEVFAQQAKVLQDFCNHVKGRRATELKGHMVLVWLDGHTSWNDSTRTWAKKVIKAVCNWGVKQGYLEEHPLKKLPSGGGRRRDRVLTPDEVKRILEFVSPAFADFLSVVGQTGARPYSEIARLDARHINWAESTATLASHKNAKKTGKPRVLYFTEDSMGILRRLAAAHPVGPLFRTARHSRWSRVSAWKWFREIETKLGIKAHVYALRHTRITEAIVNGVPVEVIAELVGNTPQVIHRHYSHVGQNQAAMRAAAKLAAGSSG